MQFDTYYWVIDADLGWHGPYDLRTQAEQVKDRYDGSEVFPSQYRNLAKAKQSYRESNPEFQHTNFKAEASR